MKTILIFLAATLWLNGCHDEAILPATGTEPIHPDNRIVCSLYTSVDRFQAPVTRTGKADEENIGGDIWVFVFDASTPDTLFIEAALATPHDGASAQQSQRSVSLKSQSRNVTLLILANPPSHYFDGANGNEIQISDAASWNLSPSTSLAEALTRLRSPLLETPQTVVPFTPGQKIPLTTRIELPKLDASTTLGTGSAPLLLQRITARIVVKKEFSTSAGSNSLPLFSIRGITVGRVPRNTTLFPSPLNNSANLTDYRYPGSTVPDSTVIGIAPAVDDSTTMNPIYVYPTDEPTESHQPYIIVQARFDTDATDSYYKLVPASSNRKLERNTNYMFRIKRCSGRGYSTLNEAIDALPSNLLEYEMEVVDLSSHDLIDNGQYYLGASNSEYLLFATGEVRNAVVTTLSYKQTNGVTDTLIIDRLVGHTPVVVTNPFDGAGSTSKELRMDFPLLFTSCRVILRLGNLEKTIEITRHPSLSYPAHTEAFFSKDEFVYGRIEIAQGVSNWIGLSTDSTPGTSGTEELTNNTGGGFFLKVKSNISPTDPDADPSRNAILYLSRRNNQGRVKAYLQQEFVYQTPS